MKKCPNCGAQMIDGSLFCTECGKPIPQGNVCPHCGASVNESDIYCQSCGNKLDNAISPKTLLEKTHIQKSSFEEIENEVESVYEDNNNEKEYGEKSNKNSLNMRKMKCFRKKKRLTMNVVC